MLCGLAAVKQASVLDGLSFDPFSFKQDDLASAEVDIGRGEIGDTLVVSQVIVVSDEVAGHLHWARGQHFLETRTGRPGWEGGSRGAKALCEKDAEPLGSNVIHSVTNPIDRLTGAIHVYGGDFFGAERSEWNPEALTEGRYDVAKTLKMFKEANTPYRTG